MSQSRNDHDGDVNMNKPAILVNNVSADEVSCSRDRRFVNGLHDGAWLLQRL